jgi:tetratricopeptide (TPR) repeat protein
VSKSARVAGAAPTRPPIVGSSKLRGSYISEHVAEAVARPKPAIPWSSLNNPQLAFLTDGVVEKKVEEVFSNIFSETPAYKQVLETPLYKPPILAAPRHNPAARDGSPRRAPPTVVSAAAASAVTAAALAGSTVRQPTSLAISSAPYGGYTGPDRAGGGGLARLNKSRIGPNALSRPSVAGLHLSVSSASSAAGAHSAPPQLALTCALEHSLTLSPLQRGLTARIRDTSASAMAASAAAAASAGAASPSYASSSSSARTSAGDAAGPALGPITSTSLRMHSAAAAHDLATVATYAASGSPAPASAAASAAAAVSSAAAARARAALSLTQPPSRSPARARYGAASASARGPSRGSATFVSASASRSLVLADPSLVDPFPPPPPPPEARAGSAAAGRASGGDAGLGMRPFATAAEAARARAPAPPAFGNDSRAVEAAAVAAVSARAASARTSARLAATAAPLALSLRGSSDVAPGAGALVPASPAVAAALLASSSSTAAADTGRLTVPPLSLPPAPIARALTARALASQQGALAERAADVRRVSELQRRQNLPALNTCVRLPPPPALHAPQRLEDPDADPAAALPFSLRARTARRAAGLAAAGSTREVAAERARALTQEEIAEMAAEERARVAAASEQVIMREIAALNASNGAAGANGGVVVSAVRARPTAPAATPVTAASQLGARGTARLPSGESSLLGGSYARGGSASGSGSALSSDGLDADAREARLVTEAQDRFSGTRALTARPREVSAGPTSLTARLSASGTGSFSARAASATPFTGFAAGSGVGGSADAAALASKGARRSAELFEGHRAALLRLVRDYTLRAQACARAGQARAEANAYYCIGVLHENLRCPRAAAGWYSKFVLTAHAARDEAMAALGHNSLGIALAAAAAAEASTDEDVADAVRGAIAQHEAHLAVADLYGLYVANTNIGVLNARLGCYGAAAAAHKRALEAAAELQAPVPLITATGNLGLAAFSDGAFDAAAACLEQFLELGEQFPALMPVTARAAALLALGEIAVAQKEYGYAKHLLQNALDEAAKAGDWSSVSKCRVALGVVSGAAAAEDGLRAVGAAMMAPAS